MLERGRVLVAYDMGLGKTVITIAALEQLYEDGELDAGLIVALSSLKWQWAQQIAVWTDCDTRVVRMGDEELVVPTPDTCVVVEGSPAQRAQQYAWIRKHKPTYALLHYEQVVNDWKYVRKLPRDFVVCDEVTAIKSFRSQRSRRVKRLQADFLYGLTGQPIENKAEELFSILQWVDDEVLGRHEHFDKAFIVRNPFGGIKRYRNLPTLHRRVADVMVRKSRYDEDVKPYLPEVMPPVVKRVRFDRPGAKLYRVVAAELLEDLTEAAEMFGSNFDVSSHYGLGDESPDANAMRGRIMAKLTCLRMLCDHPQLLRLSAAAYRDTGPTGSEYADELDRRGVLGDNLGTPKLDAAMRYLDDLLEEAPKVVLFSYFKPTLRMIQRRTEHDAVLFHGDMDARAKEAAKRHFQTDPACRLFLSSDAGGYGVDLPQASALVNYNLPWSSGKLEQRNSRIIRASSEFRAVTIGYMLMRGSVEEHYHAGLNDKKAVADAVVDGKGINAKGGVDLTMGTLTDWLSKSDV